MLKIDGFFTNLLLSLIMKVFWKSVKNLSEWWTKV